MTVVLHAYAGAVIYRALSRWFGVGTDMIALAVGAILGSAPDTLDWVAHKFVGYPRYGPIYQFLHKNKWAILIQVLLVAPGFGHVLPDMTIHEPVIPLEGRSEDYDMVLFRLPIFRTPIRRRDIHWLTGEIMLVALATLLLVLT